ncbi:hypothetical protein PCO86_02850 [Pectobacteriaceae bacterium CE70]|nr:hypothetical protein PCO87_02950 [Pectobacteriaceae bacterium C52]WJV67409.1 hypothetical protein PCO86_02850 [Pectobacteriaceae bacterium CE70]WJY11391.1 hypothetical protein PCO80_02860 [Pectobacteriaceae bacterium C80]
MTPKKDITWIKWLEMSQLLKPPDFEGASIRDAVEIGAETQYSG